MKNMEPKEGELLMKRVHPFIFYFLVITVIPILIFFSLIFFHDLNGPEWPLFYKIFGIIIIFVLGARHIQLSFDEEIVNIYYYDDSLILLKDFKILKIYFHDLSHIEINQKNIVTIHYNYDLSGGLRKHKFRVSKPYKYFASELVEFLNNKVKQASM